MNLAVMLLAPGPALKGPRYKAVTVVEELGVTRLAATPGVQSVNRGTGTPV